MSLWSIEFACTT